MVPHYYTKTNTFALFVLSSVHENLLNSPLHLSKFYARMVSQILHCLYVNKTKREPNKRKRKKISFPFNINQFRCETKMPLFQPYSAFIFIMALYLVAISVCTLYLCCAVGIHNPVNEQLEVVEINELLNCNKLRPNQPCVTEWICSINGNDVHNKPQFT